MSKVNLIEIHYCDKQYSFYADFDYQHLIQFVEALPINEIISIIAKKAVYDKKDFSDVIRIVYHIDSFCMINHTYELEDGIEIHNAYERYPFGHKLNWKTK